MKLTLLQLIVFFFTCLLAFQVQGQVTINQSDFPREASFIDSLHFTNQTGIAVPTEGPNQVWNYSTLQAGEFRSFEHFDATADPVYTASLNYFQNDLTFQGFLIESKTYEAIDPVGFFEDGRSITDVTHSITAITGGPNDVLHFIGENQFYSSAGLIDEISFPLTYEKTWTNSRNELINFQLTVAAYGLNQVPGNRRRFKTQTSTVVGHGSLTIPKSDGSPSVPVDALLVKVERTNVDSFFLGGAPAPQALLNAFGLVQGTVDVAVFYNFYTPGFAGRVLDIGMSDTGTAEDAFYRSQAVNDLTAAINELDLAVAQGFPNPVSAGQELTVTLETPIGSGYVSFTDLAGRQVFQTAFAAVGNQFQVDIPAATEKGLYFYQVLNQKGIPIGLGKLQVN